MVGRLLDWVSRHRRMASALLVADLAVMAMLVFSGGGSAISFPTLPTNDLQNLLAYLDSLRGDTGSGAEVKKAEGIR